jgi:hypothetical protein
MTHTNLTTVENLKNSVMPLSEYLNGQKTIPDISGLYSFWWINSNPDDIGKLYLTAKLKGKQMGREYEYHDIHWKWNLDQPYICLYIGKATSIVNRVNQHLLLSTSSDEWYLKEFTRYRNKTALKIVPNKNEDLLVKRSTSCQFRAGLEHLFKHSPITLDLKLKNIGFTFLGEKDPIERFYLEDLAIGWHRPWFNVDSER